MPTTIPLISRDVNPELQRRDVPARETNADLVVLAAIAAAGFLLTIGLAVFFPLAANAAALIWIVT